MSEKSNLGKPIIGYSDNHTVMVDFDDLPFKVVKYWASRACNFHHLQGYIILKSSRLSYHVVFNRYVSWSENMRILAWIALESGNICTQRYHIMQCIKQSSTLRVSPKGTKPQPRIVYRDGRQVGRIRDYLQHRKLIKKIVKKVLSKSQSDINNGEVKE